MEAAGGMVVWAGTWRVAGVLAVSRAFGDKPLKRFVISTPYMQEEQLQRDDEFLILASDGVWDVFSNEVSELPKEMCCLPPWCPCPLATSPSHPQEAVAVVRGIEDAEAAAKKLTEEAYGRGSMDNISCIIVRFKHAALPPQP